MGGPRAAVPMLPVSPPSPIVYEKLGSGSYGVVISPALGNIDEAGKPIEFPGLVSKLMISENSFDKAVKLGQKLKAKVPAMAINFTPYRKKFTLKNLPAGPVYDEVRDALRMNMASPVNQAALNASPVYVARMPNLGKSAQDISFSDALKAEYAKRGPRVMISEILKILRVIKDTIDGKYVHADIREPNFLINVITGTMTIIDFDMMEETFEYHREYPSFYYSHPPEEMYLLQPLVPGFAKAIDMTKTNPAQFQSAVKAMLTKRSKDAFNHMYWVDKAEQPAFLDIVYDAAKSVYDQALRAPSTLAAIKAAQAISIRTVDTYGFGVACLKLFTDMLEAGLLDQKLADFLLDDLFPAIMHPNFGLRATPEDAISKVEGFIRANYPDLLPAVPTAADEASRLIRTVKLVAPAAAEGGGAAAGGGGNINVNKLAKVMKVLKRPENNVDPTKLIVNLKPSGGGVKGGRRRRQTRRKRT